ncbi:MAG TPA: sensor histidine kinase [Clostridia bacterium]
MEKTIKVDFPNLDNIIKKTIAAIDTGKHEILDIAENAKKECGRLEAELVVLKQQTKDLLTSVERMEKELKESKRKLMNVNRNFENYSQEELKAAYQKADNLRIELAVKREQEQNFLRRRNELELRIKDSVRTLEKADRLISSVGVALTYLTGDLKEVSSQLNDMQHRQLIGLKVIKAQEEERQRVAREIHDGPAQSMSNVVLKAEICERLSSVDLEKMKEELRNLKSIVRDCLQDVRKIIYDLRPMSLDDLGLIPTIKRYIATFQDENGIHVSFKTRGEYECLKPVVSLTSFRIIQEALNNIKKHANAKNVNITVEFIEDSLKLNVFDNGKGFKLDEVKKNNNDINSGFGLASMKERVQLLDGSFEIDSMPGRGTHISVSLPLVREGEEWDG